MGHFLPLSGSELHVIGKKLCEAPSDSHFPTATRPSRSICCCRFPMVAHNRKLTVIPKASSGCFCVFKGRTPIPLFQCHCQSPTCESGPAYLNPLSFFTPGRPFEPLAFTFFTGLCCYLNRPYWPSALPGLPKGFEPPLEPSAEVADDVIGSPLRCSGGRV